MRRIFLYISLIILLSFNSEVRANNLRIIDGDTIELNGEKIRFSGIDTPEPKQICRLDDIEIPTLVIHGDADGQVPYYLGKELSDLIRNSELVTVGGAGHGVMNWAGSVEALKSFCDRLKPLQQ